MSLNLSLYLSGFLGPKDIFRNPESVFELNNPRDTYDGHSPFDLVLTQSGEDFSLMGTPAINPQL